MPPAKPAVVGGFVLGALLIGVVAALIFGGTQWFTSTVRVMVVFRNSVAGLATGSPVTFRGVTIGKVESIRVRVKGPDHAPFIQVYIALEPDQLSWTSGTKPSIQAELKAAVAEGLRAQLSAQSLITGELGVDLDYYPHAPPAPIDSSDSALQIPSIASDLQQFKDQVRNMNLPEIANEARRALGSLQHIADTLDQRVGPVSDGIQETLKASTAAVNELELRSTRTLAGIDRLATASRVQVTKDGEELDQLLQTAQRATAQTEALAASLNDMTSPRSAMRGDLEAALRDLAASSSSLRTFSHELERNPAATLLKRSSP
jgi:paraquat-inducible protein B